MSQAVIFFADGLEEIEGLTVVDMLRRAGVDIQIVSVTGNLSVTGSHKIRITADVLFEEADFADTGLFVLPGGMPGTLELAEHRALGDLLKKADQDGRLIAAICAAPSVLGGLGLLSGRKATCYPGYEEKLTGAETSADQVVCDGNIITSRGMGTAIPFSAILADRLCGEGTGEKLLNSIIYK